MKFTKTEIEGVYLIEPAVHQDERGEFFRTYDQKLFEEAGLKEPFVQHNHSLNFEKGTWRGFHFQYPPSTEMKLIRCVSGKVFDVVLDVRAGSKTFLQWRGFELSEKNKLELLIPAGCAHGFIALEDRSALIYHHTQFYDPKSEAGIRHNDPQINLKLPISITRISERDNMFPMLTNEFKGVEL